MNIFLLIFLIVGAVGGCLYLLSIFKGAWDLTLAELEASRFTGYQPKDDLTSSPPPGDE